MKRNVRSFAMLLSTLAALAGSAQAGTIGQWDGSGVDAAGNLLTWNSPLVGPTYATGQMRALITAAGHTVGPDAPITAAALATYDSLVIRMPRVTPSASELSLLTDWINQGGLLLMIVDRDMLAGEQPFNNILAGVGSSIHAESYSVDQNFALSSGLFLSDGPPYNIAGSYMSPSPGRWLSGGTALSHGSSGWTSEQQAQAEAIIRYQQVGLGYAIGFADTLDVDYFTPTSTDMFGRMFLNAASYHNPGLEGGGGGGQTPEPSSLLLAATGLGGALLLARLRRPEAGQRRS